MSDSTEVYYAEMEAARNEVSDAYFKARPQWDTSFNRNRFREGFERGFQKAWNLRPTQETRAHPPGSCLIGGDCEHVQETGTARRCRCGQVEWEDGARRISCGDGSDHYVDLDCVSAANRGREHE